MKRLIIPLLALGIFVCCQRDELLVPLVSDTTISVIPQEQGNGTAFSESLALAALTGQRHISAEEAQELALSTAAQMREVEGILTKSPLQIASVEVVANNERKPYVATKSNETPEQGDVYIINFANNQGYVITSADRRVPGVLAYNSYGNLGEEIDNPGQAIMLSYMQEYIEQERENFEKNKETLKLQAEEHLFTQLSKEKQKELIEKGYFDEKGKRVKMKNNRSGRISCFFDSSEEKNANKMLRPIMGEWKEVSVIPPLVKTTWGQSGYYNDKVSLNCGNDEAPVGCVATAVGQLMAYHKKPAVFKDRTMNWEDMTKIDAGDMFSNIYSNAVFQNTTAKEDIQHLLARLGDSDLLKTDYNCGEGSAAYDEDALKTLNQLGYHNAYLTNYSNSLVISELKKHRPIYVSGASYEYKRVYETTYTTGWWFWKKKHTRVGTQVLGYGKGHAWVIDGYVRKEQETEYLYLDCNDDSLRSFKNTEVLELIHNNFGWYGSNNGWYHIGIFNTKGEREPSNTYKSGTDMNFQYTKTIIANIN